MKKPPIKETKKTKEYSPQEVMIFAGDIMTQVFKLAETGNAHEKRVCQTLIRGAQFQVSQVRHQRFIMGLGL